MAIKVGINGFGRIGRMVVKAGLNDPDIEFVAVNDLTDAKTLAHLFAYDSVHGPLGVDVKVQDDSFVVDGRKIRVLAERDPLQLPWGELGVSVVVESTGLFRSRDKTKTHLDAGAKKVIITAPAKGDVDLTIVLGVNDAEYDPSKHHIVSNASCTTNCLAPVAKVLHDNFGIIRGFMTTIHSYTNDQRILDLPHSDLRRARAAALSMIPTTTGAAKAVALVIPELKGKLDGLAMRVPTPNVSIVDFVAEVKKATSKEEINNVMKESSENAMKGYLKYCDLPLVSSDFNNSTYSSILDAELTGVLDGTFVKVMAWYDNEYGYSSRVKDLIKIMGK
ncbi:glyceraldehyde-3-phosphate dehydrogenase [bacterium SM23_31]|nr:MAG: glyceraldehyde-3-phosphate dehydrogenase [bacterium SM23_31]